MSLFPGGQPSGPPARPVLEGALHGLRALATGGSASAGERLLVGERGPELFIPTAAAARQTPPSMAAVTQALALLGEELAGASDRLLLGVTGGFQSLTRALSGLDTQFKAGAPVQQLRTLTTLITTVQRLPAQLSQAQGTAFRGLLPSPPTRPVPRDTTAPVQREAPILRREIRPFLERTLAPSASVASSEERLSDPDVAELLRLLKQLLADERRTAPAVAPQIRIEAGAIVVQGGKDPQATAEAVTEALRRRLHVALNQEIRRAAR